MMAGIPDVAWALFENSSHLPHIEEPDIWLEKVGAFLDRLDRRQGVTLASEVSPGLPVVNHRTGGENQKEEA